MGRIGRNKPCPCGSGKKYKKCCGSPIAAQAALASPPGRGGVAELLRRHKARELVRTQQQGQGRPIISTTHAEHRVVAVNNKVFFSKNWNYFTDFLSDYIKKVLDPDWGNAELQKPFEDRHPVIQWYHEYCGFQRSTEPEPDGTYRAVPTGVVQCFLGLAYGLYLLEHNAELQKRLIARLKDPQNFQGAYYEIIVASILIRAGLELALEDETDTSEKHCEFTATSKTTGRKYSVEAKMRSVAGVMGKTEKDGAPPTSKPNNRLSTHLREALRKPGQGERLIFIDVNTPITSSQRPDIENDRPMPRWMEVAIGQLDDRERDLEEVDTAYVFVTNFAFHHHLNDEAPAHSALAYGLGMPDFSKPGERRLVEIWRSKQKHIDAHEVFSALQSYPAIPSTFDGSLPLSKESARNQIMIGETYFFEEPDGGGFVAKVTSATVVPEERTMYLGILTKDGKGEIRSRQMSDDELDAYRAHPQAFFGEISGDGGRRDDPYELFEWFLNCYKDTAREQLLKLAETHPDFRELKELDDMELRLALCEAWTIAAVQTAKSRKVAGP
ncbi:MAG: SEC-C domain-containing protein [Rhodospirillales bacterium]|nr:SEC-C domain-containing protein [Rhodospirillales bacterium]